jgi:3-(3-hydroxy-phenyl)propionate hydroxylase
MTPPFLGQGMCAGVRDVANLAWKLDRVVRGHSPQELLDTYQAEREPHVRHIIQLAVDFGRLICTTDPDIAAQRDADMLAARNAAGSEAIEPMGMPPLSSGALVLEGGGAQALQPTIGHARLDDVIGPAFAVVLRQPSDAEPVEWWRHQGAKVIDTATIPESAAILDHLDADVAVVRPDRYVLTSGASLMIPDSLTTALLSP